MKKLVAGILCGFLLSACAGNAKRLPRNATTQQSTNEATSLLSCLECSFVERNGNRLISGKLKNNSTIDFVKLTADIEFKDSKGGLVARQDKVPFLDGAGVGAGATKDFSIPVASGPTKMSQAILYFKRADTGETLVSPITLLLVVSLDDN